MPTLLPLWRKARRVSSAASRLPGTTSLRFALHGWQRSYIDLSVPAQGDRPSYARFRRNQLLKPRGFSESFQ
ncbi:MAG: hypothetical protein JMN24_13160 [gamma proteobacterium endosymbiont of Lamellibrachia anaximandri]|nr:hypothetical protein [gamma proteobacterium endosymbiont of Lamellibrachia anaximandri]